MIIVIVEDSFLYKSDGTAWQAIRFREALQKRGHTVRVITAVIDGKPEPEEFKNDPDIFRLPEHYVFIATPVARWNSHHFAKYKKDVVEKALDGADIVHFCLPWQSARKIYDHARRKGIPVCGAFHVQPENVTYNAGVRRLRFINTMLYVSFRDMFYNRLGHIHCPSPFIAGRLKRFNYKAQLHVFSNGLPPQFKPEPAQTEKDLANGNEFINILMIGRLALEKQQDKIIKAVKASKYEKRIQLFFAGQGPKYKHYKKMSRCLTNAPVFGFVSQERLLEMIHNTDIYVHASEIEIEGIGCIEAIACGKVPVINNSKKSAAAQFALDPRSLFKKGDYLDLRDKIEYWIEHPAERKAAEQEYAKAGAQYGIEYSVLKLEEMFNAAITDEATEKGK